MAKPRIIERRMKEPVRVYKLWRGCRSVRDVRARVCRAVLPKSRCNVLRATLSGDPRSSRKPRKWYYAAPDGPPSRKSPPEVRMLRDDSGNGGGRRRLPRNVLGERLELCSISPMTGFFRDGCCDTGPEDGGSHTVWSVMTAAFLSFSKSSGNDPSTPMPELGVPGRKPGDRWCMLRAP